MIHYVEFDGVGLAEQIKIGATSSLQLIDEMERRAQHSAGAINAVVIDYFDDARKNVDCTASDGPLAGVPILLKNLLAQAEGTITSHSMPFLKDAVADHDSEIVRRLKNAGLIVAGKTNSPEYGYSVTTEPKLYGPTRNPWNLERSSGGSSGGAAAAVAAGIVPLAHASDGGGSIRIPASFCGCVGLKVSRGRSTYAPDFADFWLGSAVEGCISRTVRDTAAFTDIAMGALIGDPYELPPFKRPLLEEVDAPTGKLKVGVINEPPADVDYDPDCAKAVADTAALLKNLGHSVEKLERNVSWQKMVDDFIALAAGEFAAVIEASQNLMGRLLTRDDMSPVNWQRAERGAKMSAADYIIVAESVRMTARALAQQHANYDVVLSPTAPRTAPPLGQLNMYDLDIDDYHDILTKLICFTLPYNVSGEPAISLPLAMSSEGMPIGVQFSARRGEEALLIRLAGEIERAAPWAHRRAPHFIEK